jgi:predicted GTPase
MKYGAGILAASKFGAKEIVDPRPLAVGSIAETFEEYPNTGRLLPAMGYGEKQMKDLERTINRTNCDLVIIATPVDLRRVIKIKHPTCRINYELQEIGRPDLQEVLLDFLRKTGLRQAETRKVVKMRAAGGNRR